MIGEIRLKKLYQRKATAPFSKILCICAVRSHKVNYIHSLRSFIYSLPTQQDSVFPVFQVKTLFVFEQQNLFPRHMFPARLNWETFASAIMFPQQCFLV